MLQTSFRPGAEKPLACVMGGMDLVRPLGLFGVRSAVVARPGSPALYSRFTHSALRRDRFHERDEDLVDALEWLTGGAKLDFKSAPDGRLLLLEINPRFNLWHHLGAVAGVNLPALVYADLVGLPRPATRPARAGARRRAPGFDLERLSGRACVGPAAVALAAMDARVRRQVGRRLGRSDALVRSMPHGGFARANHSPAVPSLKLHEQAG
jgi:hypothetical protein